MKFGVAGSLVCWASSQNISGEKSVYVPLSKALNTNCSCKLPWIRVSAKCLLPPLILSCDWPWGLTIACCLVTSEKNLYHPHVLSTNP
jgi:hypothetical protein